MSAIRIEGCVEPDCFHCPFEDCMVSGAFPGEEKRNIECGRLPRSKGKRKRKKRKKEVVGNEKK